MSDEADDGRLPGTTTTAVLGMATIAALVALAAGALAQPGTGAVDEAASDDAIQPGDALEPAAAGLDPAGCTISYVLDGPAAVYVGFPADCADEGQAVSTPGFADFARVVHVGESVPVALARVDADVRDHVVGDVKNRPGAPAGPAEPEDTRDGDPVLTPDGAGVLATQDASVFRSLASADERPSGTPVVHGASGTLVGHLDTVGFCIRLPTPSTECGVPPVRISGPTTEAVLAGLAEEGYDLELRAGEGEDPGTREVAEAATEATRAALADDRILQPGDPLVDGQGSSYCTLNFVFDGPEEVYMGTAAHCVSEDQRVRSENVGAFGEVVHVGGGVDFALIEVDEDDAERVRASVKGHASVPTGVAEPDQTDRGDLVYVSGYGVGFDPDETTRENRWGLQLTHGGGYQVLAPFTPGDSGGPVVHGPSGRALGVAAWIGACVQVVPTTDCGLPPARAGGPSVHAILDVLHDHGYPVELRTVEDPGGLEQTVAGAAAGLTRTVPAAS
jgi:acyl-coenzyme A thioesterase PaaI-like protein